MNSRHLQCALLLSSLAVMSSACSSSSAASGGGGGSCTVSGSMSQIGFCADYLGSSYTSASVMTACGAEKATYSASACTPPSPSKGSCVVGTGATEIKYYFTSAGTGTNTAKAECIALSGTYSAK
jgi:hypothetical protein